MNKLIHMPEQRVVIPGTEADMLIDLSVSREGFQIRKMMAMCNAARAKYLHAIAKMSEVSLIEPGKIAEMTGKDVRLIILDLDECVAPHHLEVLPENVDWIRDQLNNQFQVLIYSNSKASDRTVKLCDDLDGRIFVLETPIPKPRVGGFKQGLNHFGLNPDQALMFGDNPLTDGGSNMAGIPYVQVNPIPRHIDNMGGERGSQVNSRQWAIDKSAKLDHWFGRRVIRGDHKWG